MTQSRLDSLLKFLEQEPDDVFTHYAVALEYAGMKDYKKAIKKLEEVINRDPNYVAAYQQLGRLQAQTDHEDDALRTFEKGIQVASLLGDTHAVKEMKESLDDLDD